MLTIPKDRVYFDKGLNTVFFVVTDGQNEIGLAMMHVASAVPRSSLASPAAVRLEGIALVEEVAKHRDFVNRLPNLDQTIED